MFKYIKIGKTLKPVHSTGEMIVNIQNSFIEDAINSKALFIEIDGLNVPFFIENIECKDNVCYVKFEEFNNPEDAKKYNNTDISLRDSDINREKKQNDSISNPTDFEGFEIFDLNSKTNHRIESIEQFPQQLMAKTTSRENNKEFFIPLIKEFISEIDFAGKTIIMSLPDGLVND